MPLLGDLSISLLEFLSPPIQALLRDNLHRDPEASMRKEGCGCRCLEYRKSRIEGEALLRVKNK